jgi:ATP-dependent DNA helicase
MRYIQELDVKFEEEAPTDAETSELEEKYKRLKHVLEQSTLYSSALKRQMDEAKEEHKKTRLERLAAARERRPAKRTRHSKAAEEPIADEVEDDGAFPQPRLVTGARLKDYQLEGLQWMVSLHSNGISGILGNFSPFFRI